MTTTSKFLTYIVVPQFIRSGAIRGALCCLLVALLASGCSFVSGSTGSGRGGLRQPVAADEPLFVPSRKTLKQVSVQSSRVLPKPEFGITPEVQSELDRFLTQDRSTVENVLDKHSQHYEALGKVFEGEGVPVELLTVAAVESGYNSRAMSPAGARGMWQFMKGTARSYGLLVSARKDERLDPIRSTAAAAKHLRSLFLTFNDWSLALAAYNAGAGAINRTMSRSGDNDFWELSRSGSLSGETRRFVPKVIALSMIVRDPEKFGFNPNRMVG
jgi:hypothetical protein